MLIDMLVNIFNLCLVLYGGVFTFIGALIFVMWLIHE
jgi:hypothetical protein